jgi:hypothetical protein
MIPITPELIETAARALGGGTSPMTADQWADEHPKRAGFLLRNAEAVLAAVVPLIDPYARADELHQQARRLRDLARGAEINATNAVYVHPDSHQADRWDAIANDRFVTAKHLETCAAALITTTSEENPRG